MKTRSVQKGLTTQTFGWPDAVTDAAVDAAFAAWLEGNPEWQAVE